MSTLTKVKDVLRRRKSKQTPVQNEPTLEERVFALFDEGEFLAASNLLERELGGNAYYEYSYRWHQRHRDKA